jgi:hypothetical protein
MKRYESRTPRRTFAAAAAAMTMLTLALAVVAPAKLDERTDAAALDAATAPAIAAAAAMAPIGRIEVVALRNR